jgi:predicted  nucleic acid-binding Zn-ribbon protein
VSDTSKYDLFNDEIDSLEKMVQKFVAENLELEEKKSAISEKVEKLERENEILVTKINELEKKLTKAEDKPSSSVGKTKLDLSERENLKNQIDDLIERIDYHIRS